ncbi:MAG: aldo/keto reductase, partial [Nocardioidaceae bacterium]
TAQFYGPDVANELIHEALAPYPEDLVVVTKIGGTRDATGNWLPAQRPEELRQAVDANLATLGLAALPVLNLGRADPGAVAGTPQDVDFDDQLAAVIELRDQGTVTSLGLTNVSIQQLDYALRTVEVVCVQNRYNLLDRSDEPMVDRCAAMGIAYMPYFPLGSGIPGQAKVTDDPAVQQVARQHDSTPAQVGLAWLLAHRPNLMPIPGTSSVAHLEENLAAATLDLADSEHEQLNARSPQA